MLILARELDQRIVIRTPEGRVITAMVVAIRGGQVPLVRLGFEADPDVTIDREEIDRSKQDDAQVEDLKRGCKRQ